MTPHTTAVGSGQRAFFHHVGDASDSKTTPPPSLPYSETTPPSHDEAFAHDGAFAFSIGEDSTVEARFPAVSLREEAAEKWDHALADAYLGREGSIAARRNIWSFRYAIHRGQAQIESGVSILPRKNVPSERINPTAELAQAFVFMQMSMLLPPESTRKDARSCFMTLSRAEDRDESSLVWGAYITPHSVHKPLSLSTHHGYGVTLYRKKPSGGERITICVELDISPKTNQLIREFCEFIYLSPTLRVRGLFEDDVDVGFQMLSGDSPITSQYIEQVRFYSLSQDQIDLLANKIRRLLALPDRTKDPTEKWHVSKRNLTEDFEKYQAAASDAEIQRNRTEHVPTITAADGNLMHSGGHPLINAHQSQQDIYDETRNRDAINKLAMTAGITLLTALGIARRRQVNMARKKQ